MHEGKLSTYAELPAEDKKDEAITHQAYTGLKSCVLQGIAMAFEHQEDDAAAQKLHTALLNATDANPWMAFKNYTSELVNPFLFQWLGFREEPDFTGKAINEVAGDGWYLISTAGHVEAILLDRRNDTAINGLCKKAKK